jgi:hypothetical protein
MKKIEDQKIELHPAQTPQTAILCLTPPESSGSPAISAHQHMVALLRLGN